MKTHSTNYKDTFIRVAEDCPIKVGQVPPEKKKKTIANMEYEILSKYPYQLSSDEVLFQVHAERNGIPKSKYPSEQKKFFSKGRACFRSSPLTKRYGWGIHFDEQGKMALYGMETEAYEKFINDEKVKTLMAMRSSRKKKQS